MMELEVRYYYNSDKHDDIIKLIKDRTSLLDKGEFYEKTIQYNHPMKEYDFYSKEIDGRFRIRITKGKDDSKCMISWKKRMGEVKQDDINQEEEIEVGINSQDYNNLIKLVSDTLHMVRVESYERYRHVFKNDEVEVVIDKYPFDVCLEIENKIDSDDIDMIKDNVKKWVSMLGLRIEDSYKLSWDDKYSELCKEQGKTIYSDVLFNKDMPEMK